MTKPTKRPRPASNQSTSGRNPASAVPPRPHEDGGEALAVVASLDTARAMTRAELRIPENPAPVQRTKHADCRGA